MQQPMAVEIVAAVILLLSVWNGWQQGLLMKVYHIVRCGISGSLDHCFHRNRYDRETSPCCGEASGGQHAE